jgi:hypothetical protein
MLAEPSFSSSCCPSVAAMYSFRMLFELSSDLEFRYWIRIRRAWLETSHEGAWEWRGKWRDCKVGAAKAEEEIFRMVQSSSFLRRILELYEGLDLGIVELSANANIPIKVQRDEYPISSLWEIVYTFAICYSAVISSTLGCGK